MKETLELTEEFSYLVDQYIEAAPASVREVDDIWWSGGLCRPLGNLVIFEGNVSGWRSYLEPFNRDELVRKVVIPTDAPEDMQIAVGEGHPGVMFRIRDHDIGRDDGQQPRHLVTTKELALPEVEAVVDSILLPGVIDMPVADLLELSPQEMAELAPEVIGQQTQSTLVGRVFGGLRAIF